MFGTQFTCLMFTHVLDDCPKSLNHVFDVLRIEKPFDYFFHRFDVVSLVVLIPHDRSGRSCTGWDSGQVFWILVLFYNTY